MEINFFEGDILKKPRGKLLLFLIFQQELKKNGLFKKINQLSGNILLNKSKTIRFKGEAGEFFSCPIKQIGQVEEVGIVGLGEKSEFKIGRFQNSLAQALNQAANLKFTSVALNIDKEIKADGFQLGKLISEALYLSQYRFDLYKSKEEKKKIVKVEELNVYLDKELIKLKVHEVHEGVEFGTLISSGVCLVRDLVNEPASKVHPETLAKAAFEIEKESKGKIIVEVLDREECQRLGMEAYLGVAQGSEREPKFIILKYQNDKSKIKNKKICLIGKSITFDSGGLSLKPSEAMTDMKIDMAGGAAVLGVFKILANLNNVGNVDLRSLPEIYGILPACENMPSGKALKPGDIVKCLNGKTVEVLNTDAEGRLALADAISYAQKHLKPDYIIDLATLTGAIMVALGEDITGLFGNDEKLTNGIKKAAKDENEELWPMPLYQGYSKRMKSNIADLKNISGGRYGGAITAALFLNEFIEKKTKWVHLDIAGAAFNDKEPKGLIPKGATGWGVRTLIKFLNLKF